MPDWMKDPFNNFVQKYMTNKMEYKSDPTPKKPQVDAERASMALKWNETRGEKDPYSFSRFSGSKQLGNALGAYQTTEGELKTYGPKFLGQKVSPKDYLKDPAMQDAYTQAKVKYLGEQGLTLPQIMAAHRGGFSDLTKINDTMKKYQGYVDSGTKAYDEQPWNQNPPLTTNTQ